MKITNKKISWIVIAILFWISTTNADFDCESEENKDSDFCKLYYENVSNVCNQQEFYQNTYSQERNTPVYKTEKYKTPEEYIEDPDAWTYWSTKPEFFPLEMVKRKYREDQNNIYKCWVLQAQGATFELIDTLLQIDKTWVIKNSTKNQLKSKISLVKQRSQQIRCNLSKDIQTSKKQVLDQSTYEMCKYRYYLEFLKSYYNQIENIVPESIDDITDDSEGKIDLTFVADKRRSVLFQIDEEITHTYRVYDLAFNAYWEYQSFLPIHVVLELIKKDLIVYRENLYKTISPINQVVYKIINAMTLD